MSSIGDIVSGIAGLAGGNQQFFNPVPQFFGGVTGPQQDYTQYGYQEGLLADASQFSDGTNLGDSTMATQAATGARLGQAQEQGRISDVDAGAILQAIQTGEAGQAATNRLNQQNLNSLSSALGTLAGNALSSGTFSGGFSNPNG